MSAVEDDVDDEEIEEVTVPENTEEKPVKEAKNSFLSKLLIDLILVGIVVAGYMYFKFGSFPF